MDDPLAGSLILQIVLIAVNAFFAATEIAVISLSSTKLSHLAASGDKKAGLLVKMVEQPAGFLSTIQIGITLAGFLGSAFAADNFAGPLVNWLVNDLGIRVLPYSMMNTLAVVLITLVLSYFTLVFGELVPKRIAMQRPMSVALFSAGVVMVIFKLMTPVIFLLSASTNGILRLFGLKTAAEQELVTEEEILMMVDAGEERGTIDPEEREMIENVFEFSDTRVMDVMTHRVDARLIDIDERDDDIIALIEESGLSRFPVYEGNLNNIIGILNARDFLLNCRVGDPVPLRDLLRPAYFIPETVHTDDLLRHMQKQKSHIAVVLDEYGGLAGIITMEDLLEEIVGNIYDEFDPQAELDIMPLDTDRYRIAGDTEIWRISEILEVDLPEDEDFSTLGGLIFSELKSIPEDGSHPEIEVYGLRIRVEEMRARRIRWTIVEKIKPDAPSN